MRLDNSICKRWRATQAFPQSKQGFNGFSACAVEHAWEHAWRPSPPRLPPSSPTWGAEGGNWCFLTIPLALFHSYAGRDRGNVG
jgi:hypothetical protein